MAWTEQDYQEIVARLMASSIGVNEVPNADKADDVTSLPAFKPSGSNSEASVVNYPLEFLKGEQGEPGIQGEPGKSFKVAGEYATLEALKSAVPDGSAVDGFMAVGTEAPYDYYAWVSSAGGNNPDPSPDGKYLLLSDGTPLLLANEEPILLADNGERVASNGEWVNQGKIDGIDEAPTDGKAYGRKNGDWAEVPAKSDVLTKTNSESFTPTGDYQPATKKYVDDAAKPYIINSNGAILNKWINNTVITGAGVQGLANELFGSFKGFTEDYCSGKYTSLRFSTRHYDEEAGNYFGYIINANIQYCLSEPGNGYFELLFTFGYGSTLKSCYIYYYDVSETSNENKIVITDVVRSDNLTSITKKTAAEYEAIGSKDANTAYCVTD